MLRTGRVHLGVAVLDVLPDDLIAIPVATYPQVLLAPQGHRLGRRRTVKLADLAGELDAGRSGGATERIRRFRKLAGNPMQAGVTAWRRP